MNADEIVGMGIADTVLEEGEGTASENPVLAADAVRRYVERKLDELCVLDGAELVNRRQRRFAAF